MKKLIVAATSLFAIATLAQAADIKLAWDAVVDPSLAGYRIYKSATAGSYDKATGKVCDVSGTIITVCVVSGLPDGTYYFVATAYDKAGNESGYSNEVMAAIDTIAPAAPKGLKITTVVTGGL